MGASLLTMLAVVSAPGTDYATAEHVNDWFRHPVYGDPSFDSFTRMPGNPLHRGAPPFEWPVNGFFFENPRTGHWYVYVGLYARDYAMGEGKGMTCTVYRSTDRGSHWEHLGSPFPAEPFTFRGESSPIGHAPDVSIVYEDGVYHMIYDYAAADATWAGAAEPGANNGIAYARADRPEGPFLTTPEPVYRTGGHPLYRGKYRRGYAATLLRRPDDWLVLAMMDSGPNFSWTLFGMTAKDPQGPYSEPVFLRAVEDAYFHPPLMEFFPAFQHEGRIYAPATSVAINRNFQAIFSAPVEKAMDPNAWEVTQHGSVWHAEDVPNEHHGIWGQTFSGFIDREGIFRVMFPSRDPDGLGTINLASRPWSKPYRDGFVLTGHRGPSLTLLRRTGEAFEINADLKLRGRAAIVWDYRAPLGPDRPAADSTLHALSLTRHNGLEFEGDRWRLYRVDETGTRSDLAGGSLPNGLRELTLACRNDGTTTVRIGDEEWSGMVSPNAGALGLLVAANSHLEVTRFAVQGLDKPGSCALLYTEGILGAGAAKDFWQDKEDATFRFGKGAASLRDDAAAKWNFEGVGFTLCFPKGPQYGRASVRIDGGQPEVLDLHADTAEPSAPRLTREALPGRFHAVTVRPAEGAVPIDTLDVLLSP